MVITPDGDLVASTILPVKNSLKQAIDSGPEYVTVDMASVKMIDSTGIALLVAAGNTLEKNSGKLKIINVETEIYSLFKLMRLDKRMEMAPA